MPSVFGSYQLYSRVECDRVAETFVAERTGKQTGSRPVLIKVLHPGLGQEPAQVTRLMEHAQAARSLAHANLVPLLDAGMHSGRLYVAGARIDGISLAQLQQRATSRGERLPPRVCASIARDAALGIDAAHRGIDDRVDPRPLLHGVLGPQDLWLGRDGRCRVADMGIAPVLRSFAPAGTSLAADRVGYRAPELLARGALEVGNDQFSLGIVLWELLANRRLYPGSDESEVARRILQDPIELLSLVSPDCPGQLGELTHRMLSRSAPARFTSCAEVARALQDFIDSSGGEVVQEVAALVQEHAAEPIVRGAIDVAPVQVGVLLDLPEETRPCPSCGQQQKSGATFCTRCGADLNPVEEVLGSSRRSDWISCPDCGRDQEPGAALCVHCGAVMSAAPQAGRVCAACGRELRGDAAFCDGCGASAPAASCATAPATGAGRIDCPACGRLLKPGAAFCPGCGAELAEASTLSEVEAASDSGRREAHGDVTIGGTEVVYEDGLRFFDFGDGEADHLELSIDHSRAAAEQREGPLRGRASVIDRVGEVLEEARGGQPRVLLLVGAAGLGKTRLLQEAAKAAEEHRFCVAHALAGRFGVQVALDVFRQWILGLCAQRSSAPRDLADLQRSSVGQALGWLRGVELPAPLKQRLEQLFDGEAHDAVDDPAEHQARQSVAVTQLLASLAQDQPLCLLLDDAQLIDPASVDLLRALKVRLPAAPIVVIAAGDSESGERFPQQAERIDLTSLASAVASVVAQDCLPEGELPSAIAAAIYKRAAGNPLLTISQVRALLEAQQLVFEDDVWRIVKPDKDLLARSSAELTALRARKLSTEALQLARFAAAAGDVFSRALLEHACADIDLSVGDGVDELLTSGLVDPLARSAEHQRWSQGSSRGELLAGLGRDERRRAHLALAHGYQQAALLPERLTQELAAQHQITAGLGADAVEQIRALAQQLRDRGLGTAAADLFIDALRLGVMPLHTGTPVPERDAAALLTLAEAAAACLRRRDPARAAALVQSLLDKLEPELAPHERALALRQRALALLEQDLEEEAAEVVEQVLSSLPEGGDPALRANLLGDDAQLLERRGKTRKAIDRLTESTKLFEQALARQEQPDAAVLLPMARCYRRLGRLYDQTRRIDIAQSMATRARDLAQRAQSPCEEIRALLLAATLAERGGGLETACARMEDADEVAAAMHDPWVAAEVALEHGRTLLSAARAIGEEICARTGLNERAIARAVDLLQGADTPDESEAAEEETKLKARRPPSIAAHADGDQPHEGMSFDPAAMAEEVALSEERKQYILYVDANLDSWTHFELLGIALRADSGEVRKAYFRASKVFHPDKYFRKKLGSYQMRIERIFKAHKAAYAELSDPERRATYERGIEWPIDPAEEPALRSITELRERARERLRCAVERATLSGRAELVKAATASLER